MLPTFEIPLSRGLTAKVSECDYLPISKHKWYAHKTRAGFYAARNHAGKVVYMHRQILGASGRQEFVDHKDFDGLNNTRENIRLCTPSENTRHSRTRKTYLGMRGVCEQRGKWVAQISVNGKWTYIGIYETARDAGIAYAAAAKVLFGEFAPPVTP